MRPQRGVWVGGAVAQESRPALEPACTVCALPFAFPTAPRTAVSGYGADSTGGGERRVRPWGLGQRTPDARPTNVFCP
jgi:hypothetical protein